MTVAKPTRKDVAEFFRLSLLAGLPETQRVVDWADTIVANDCSPHFAFIELCLCASKPVGEIQALLGNVPGRATPELPMRMLLGHLSRCLREPTSVPEQVLVRLCRLSHPESFPESVYFELIRLENDYALARDGVFGSLSEVIREFADFLAGYDEYAPPTNLLAA
jgi:hypothetical protein